MSDFRITRRQLLSAAATSAVAGLAIARDTQVPGSAVLRPRAAAPTPSPSVPAQAPPTAAWLDGMLTGEDLAAACATLAPVQPRTLEHDVLWQWRRELAQELRAGVRAIAITRWDKAFVLKGLAREEALPVRQARISHSLFRTEIG